MGASQAGSSEDRILLAWRGFLPKCSLVLLPSRWVQIFFLLIKRSASIMRPDIHLLHYEVWVGNTSSHWLRLPQKIEFGPTHPPRNRLMSHCQVGMQRPQFGEDGREDHQFSRKCGVFLGCLLYLPGKKFTSSFIYRQHVRHQLSGNSKCRPVPVASL
jgi:hypothetical protein